MYNFIASSDQIGTRFVKLNIPYIVHAEWILYIVYWSVRGDYPILLEAIFVAPIPEKNNINVFYDHLPITVLCGLSKLSEKNIKYAYTITLPIV